MVKNLSPALWMLIFISTTLVQADPFNVHKRQSDQRVAELETLLSLRRYGAASAPRKMEGRNSPGYGLIDFNYIGRRKKSVRSGAGNLLEDGPQRRLASSSSLSSSSLWPSEFSSRSFHGISSMKSPAAKYHILSRKVQ